MSRKRKLGFLSSIHFKIPLVIILVLLLGLQLVGAYFIRNLEKEMLRTFDDQMSVQIGFLEDSVRPVIQEKEGNEADKKAQLINSLRRFNVSNVLDTVVVNANGQILASSNPSNQGNVGQQTTDTTIRSVLYNNMSLNKEYFDSNENIRIKKFVVPIFSSENAGLLLGVLCVTVNIETVYNQVQNIGLIFITSSVIALVFSILLAFLVSKGITRPIQAMTDQIEKIADGNYNDQVKIYSKDEMGILARSINYLSVRVKEAQETTEAERQRLDSVLKHMTDGVIATDRRSRVMITNNRALDFIGKTEEEVIGHSIMEVLNLRDKYTFRELLNMDHDILIPFVNEDGQESIIKGEISVIQRESRYVSGLIWVLTDVTEREKIERDRRQFVSNVSHELRTPLTSVRSYSEALSDGALEDPKLAREFLDVIQRETDRMIRMISDLLSLSRMDSNRQEMNLELIDLSRLVDHILDRFDMMLSSEEYANKDYKILRELSDKPIWVEADQDRLTQIIDNILNNAIKYSPDGGNITVRLMTTHNEALLSIQDQGLGIPQKAIPHIFERFYRVDKARSREQGGTGLGLAIAKEVVERLNGRIWVNSIENKGSSFYISLPYDPTIGEDEWS
ncbi:cell wall metabolism sensor histidine kinase WalK [Aerococcus christensenii]|uniref:histidine kinase n=1 Tax=Aerococcus christensenii TaxID=87541 RepID=A0A2I1K8V8_9LACT|nr:cell wall metabolism sensor histidine kinase WalK [Aerococcus christensenii]PKY92068.1 cell wall metabolism sensor histidine kinase WalK [Aerococcus christensenii]WEB70800.1 cell wall metabolism sensor histidine kinase WalK [Aerococcus christensenii]